MNSCTRPSDYISSDRCLWVFFLQTTFAADKEKAQPYTFRFRELTQEEFKNFNMGVFTIMIDLLHNHDNLDLQFNLLSQNIVQCAEDCFREIPPQQRQSYISEDTWNIIIERNLAQKNG